MEQPSLQREESIASGDLDDLGEDDEQEEEQQEVLAKKETRTVRCLKFLVIWILLSCGAAIAACVYVYTSNEEESTFHYSFHDYAQQIIDTVDMYAQNKLEALGALALLIQAHAINMQQRWPLVTVPFFEEHVQGTKSLTDCYGIFLCPIVNESMRHEYVNYTLNHRSWINASYAAQREIQGYDESGLEQEDYATVDWFEHLWSSDYYNESNPDFSAGIASDIFTTRSAPGVFHPVVEFNNPGPHFPQWQAAPMSAYYQSSVNLNYGAYDDFFEQTKIIRETSNAAFGIAWTDQDTDGYVSTLLYPIFDQFHGDGKEVVAFLGLDILWKAFLQNILPPETKPIHVVVFNSCGQTFTFLLVGDDTIFQGDGDLHDVSFDSMEKTTVFGNKLMEPVSEESCEYNPEVH